MLVYNAEVQTKLNHRKESTMSMCNWHVDLERKSSIMVNWDMYNFKRKIEDAYQELLGRNVTLSTLDEPKKLAQEMSNLEQNLKQSHQVSPTDINKISFDNFQTLVTRIGWLNNQPQKFEEKKELSLLFNSFDEWINNAYEILKVTRTDNHV